MHRLSTGNVVDASFAEGLELAKVGDFDGAAAQFRRALESDPQHVDSLHSLATMQIISADLDGAVLNHQQAVGLAKTMPPLAQFYADKVNLGGLEKIFYVASAQKKKLSDTVLNGGHMAADTNITVNAPTDGLQVPTAQLYQTHKQMAALLEHSGFIPEALVHFDRAVSADPLQLDMRLHTALTLPVVYTDIDSLRRTRARLEEQLVEIQRLLKDGTLKPLAKITSFATPSTFYIAYQGAEDYEVMRQVAAIYEEAAPGLVDYISPHIVRQKEAGEAEEGVGGGAGGKGAKKAKVRVGFLSPSLHEHSVCKLLCGVINGLDREKFEVRPDQHTRLHTQRPR
jgi:predicted O-linked N-acetylglucosamine transferase (SPINDLY family)